MPPVAKKDQSSKPAKPADSSNPSSPAKPSKPPKPAKEQVIALDPTKQPWEYHPWESSAAFNAFQIYLRLGPSRSFAKVHFEQMTPERRAAYLEKVNGKNQTSQTAIESAIESLSIDSHEDSCSPDSCLPDECSPDSCSPEVDDKSVSKALKPAARKGRPPAIPGGSKGIGISPTLFGWGQRYLWAKRTQAWDEHVAAIERQAIIDARKKLAEKCVNMGSEISDMGMVSLRATKDIVLKPVDALKLVETGIKIERQGLGIDDETAAKINVAAQVNVNFESLETSELHQLIALQRKMAGIPSAHNQAAPGVPVRLRPGSINTSDVVQQQ